MPIEAMQANVKDVINSMGYEKNKREASSALDKDAFLKLLGAQLSNQDPQASQDPNQYFQTISQMSVVEQLTNLTTATEYQVLAQQAANATAMIGRTVTYLDEEGKPQSGTLESVQTDRGITTVTVSGKDGIYPGRITEVK